MREEQQSRSILPGHGAAEQLANAAGEIVDAEGSANLRGQINSEQPRVLPAVGRTDGSVHENSHGVLLERSLAG